VTVRCASDEREVSVTSGPALPDPFCLVLDWGRRYRLSVFNLGLACCAVEFAAAAASYDLGRQGVVVCPDGPECSQVMVVSGTVTDRLAPAVRRVYEQLPEPRYVISFGACANCGGPYWDSYCVTKGVDQIVPVDVYVPGCPPRPEALVRAILRLHQQAGATPAPQARSTADLTAPVVPPPGSGSAGRESLA
jgi:NADH-quinone oxidoreductase, B subunit